MKENAWYRDKKNPNLFYLYVDGNLQLMFNAMNCEIGFISAHSR
jgi:hypothetical protein